MTDTKFADDFTALMKAFAIIETKVAEMFPAKTETERYEIAKAMMNEVLGFNSKTFSDSLAAGDSVETARAKSRSSCSCDLCEQHGGCDDPNH